MTFGHFLSDQYFLLAGCNLKIKPTCQAKLIQIPDTHGAVVMFNMTTEHESVTPEFWVNFE